MALQRDLQQWSNYPTHFLSIERQNNICSITHSPGESLRCVKKSSSLEYMKDFARYVQLYDLVAMATKARCTVRHAQLRYKGFIKAQFYTSARFQMSK